MNKPDYHGGSILNLMSSISKALGAKTKYKPLKLLPPLKIKDSKNIVLLVIDGLGYEFLKKYGKNTILNKYLKGKITSVFPSSTAAAITSIWTGNSSKELGMPGWHLFMKEFGTIVTALPYLSKIDPSFSMSERKDIKEVFNINPLIAKFKSQTYFILKENVINSEFTKAASGKSKRIKFKNLKDMLKIIKKTINSHNKRKFIFAYYADHDSLGHHHGIKSKEVINHFKELNKEITKFINSLEKNTTVIITADHGQIQIPKSKLINLEKHPKLNQTLSLPLTGEHRFAYCYVKPSKEKEFLKYVKTKLKKYCEVYKSSDLIKKGYFGLFKEHPSLKNRIGDYTLIMKENYAIYNKFHYKNNKEYNVGDHGGLSDEELYVPIIVIKK